MIRNLLAVLGLIFLILLVALGMMLLAGFWDLTGVVSIPKGILQTPFFSPRQQATVTISVTGGVIERSNPLETLFPPTPMPMPTSLATPTLAPTLDPLVYQDEVMLQLKNFAAALKTWQEANDRVALNSSLLDDPSFQEEMRADLANVRATGDALSNVGPAPAQYEKIDAWLKRVGPEAEGLEQNYLKGMQNRDTQSFSAASDNFQRIKEYLTQAVNEMLAANWSLQ